MFVIYDKSQGKYYNGLEWVDSIRDCMHVTRLRAEEILESITLHVSKGLMQGEFVIQEVEETSQI